MRFVSPTVIFLVAVLGVYGIAPFLTVATAVGVVAWTVGVVWLWLIGFVLTVSIVALAVIFAYEGLRRFVAWTWRA